MRGEALVPFVRTSNYGKSIKEEKKVGMRGQECLRTSGWPKPVIIYNTHTNEIWRRVPRKSDDQYIYMYM